MLVRGACRARRAASTATAQAAALDDLLRNLAARNTSAAAPARPRVAPAPLGPRAASLSTTLKPAPPPPAAATTLLAAASPVELLAQYMNGRAALSRDLGACVLVLARLAALQPQAHATSPEPPLRGEAGQALLRDALQLLREGAPTSARLLASLLHSLARMAGAGGGRPLASAGAAAATVPFVALARLAAAQLAGGPTLEQLPPRPLAMAAWALARLGSRDESLFLRVSFLAFDGAVCAAWPRWISAGAGREAQDDGEGWGESGRRGASSASRRRAAIAIQARGSPFAPAELAMLATALATALGNAPASVSASVSASAAPLDRLAALAAPMLPAFPHAALVSLIWALASTPAPSPAERANSSAGADGAAMSEQRARTLMAAADELAARFEIAQSQALQAAGATAAGPAAFERPESDTVADEAGAALERRQLAALAAARARESSGTADDLFGSGEGESESDGDGGTERSKPLSPRAVATALRAYAAAGLRAPQLLSSAARLLAAPGVAAGFDGESLANVTWACARTRYDSPATAVMWDAIVESATQRLAATPLPSAAAPLRPSQLATLLWAASSSSVRCAPLARAALQRVGERPSAFSLPALAQLLWACALQGEYGVCEGVGNGEGGEGEPFRAALEHVLTLAELRGAVTAQGFEEGLRGAAAGDGEGEGLSESLPTLLVLAPGDPDAQAAVLLRTRLPPRLAFVGRTQSQLFTALLGLQLDRPAAAATREALALVPSAAAVAWRGALLRQHTRPSRLQADVSRVLAVARLAHVQEHATAAGLVCDVLLTPAPSPGAADSGAPARPVVIEVQGPSHFTRGLDVAAALARDAAGAPSFRSADALLLLRRSRAESAPSGEVVVVGGGGLAAARALLVPTLRTVAKARWLAALGYDVVSVDFVEWADAVSTQEKLQLLKNKGLRVPERML